MSKASNLIKRNYTQLAQRLVNKIGGGLKASIQLNEDSEAVEVGIVVKNVAGGSLMTIKRTFRKSGKTYTLYNDLMVITDSLQGMGLSNIINTTGVETLHELGGQYISVHANIDRGGYVWLRKGFIPHSWKDIDQAIAAYRSKNDPFLKMSKAEKLAFVQTEEFKEYRDSLENTDWYGQADTKDPVVLSKLTGKALDTEAITKQQAEKTAERVLKKIKSRGIESSYKIIKTDKGYVVEFTTPEGVESFLFKDGKLEPTVNIPEKVVENQVNIERVKQKEINNQQKYSNELDRYIRERISGLDVESLSQLSNREFNKLISDIAKKQTEELVKRNDGIWDNLELFSDVQAQFESNLLARMGAFGIKTNINPFGYITKQPIQGTGDLLKPFLSDLNTREIKRVEGAIRIARSNGMTLQQAIRSIRGTKSSGYTDGTLGKNWKDAQVTIRTAYQHAAVQSQAAVYVANSDLIEEYQIVSTLDYKTSTICRTMDGKIFKIGKGPLPPFHPGCRTSTTPVIKDSIFDEGGTRSSIDGYVPQNMTYYEWLSTRTPEEQDKVIGKIRGKLFRDGGLSVEKFDELQLNSQFQPMTLEEMREKVPEAFKKANI